MEKVKTPKIAIFGIGTAGCNLLDVLAESDIGDKVKLVAVDEKGSGIDSRKVDVKIQLHRNKPRSLRPGIMPERGRRGALEVYNEIIEAMKQ